MNANISNASSTTDTFLNVSSSKLNPKTKAVLTIGLKFIPVPTTSNGIITLLRANLAKFHRSIKLRYHFGQHQKKQTNSVHGKQFYRIPNPSWMPPESNRIIEDFITENENIFTNLIDSLNTIQHEDLEDFALKFHKSHNDTTTAISKLKSLSNVIIKQADKNVATCLLDKFLYINSIDCQILHNEGNFRKIDQQQKDSLKLSICNNFEKLLTQHIQHENH
jgi:hypothetical protein